MNMAFSYLERMRMQFCMKLLDIYLSIRKTFLSMISKKTVNKPEIRRIVIVYRISDVAIPKRSRIISTMRIVYGTLSRNFLWINVFGML